MCVQISFKYIFTNLLRHKLSFHAVFRHPPHSTNHLIPAPIINGNLKIQAIIIFRGFLKLCNSCTNILIKPCLISKYPYFHPILIRSFNASLHIITQKLHKRFHFTIRSVPVFRGKRIHCQIFYTHLISRLTDALHILASLYMPVISRHPFCLCPSSVSIQNNRNMLRYIHPVFLLRLFITKNVRQTFLLVCLATSNLRQRHFPWRK